MRYKIRMLLVVGLSLILLYSNFGFTNAIRYEILNANISIGDKAINNQTLKYPIVVIKGEIYLPLTWEFSKALGYTLYYDSNSGLQLKGSSRLTPEHISNKSFGSSLIKQTPSKTPFVVRINQTPVSDSYIISNMTYIPVSTLSAFQYDVHYTMSEGLVITSSILEKRPAKYNTYDSLDAQLFIRNQGKASSCWAFAANTLFELKIATSSGEVVDFSEDHMIWHTPIPSTYESGGNFIASSTYFINQIGPIDESLAPLGTHSRLQVQNPTYKLTHYEEYNNSITNVKDAIQKHGAVLTSLYLNEADTKVYNTKTASYYNPSETKPRTHELVLVGWDDAYEPSNFTIAPKHKGAFIAQNSFGNSWGENGFFYISYEDVHILDQVYAITAYEKSTAPQILLNYDVTGITHFESYLAEDYQDSTGVVQYKSPLKKTLRQVSLYIAEDNTHIKLYLGKGKFNQKLGLEQLVVKNLTKGYHTFDLTKGFALAKDELFWIAVTFDSDHPFSVPIEAPYPGINYTVQANTGEGFIGDGSSYTDITTLRSKASIAIRAHLFD